MQMCWDCCMSERGVKEEKTSVYERPRQNPCWIRMRPRQKMRYDIRDPNMIATWRVVHHNLKIEFLRLGFTFSKPSLWNSISMWHPRGSNNTNIELMRLVYENRVYETRFPRVHQPRWKSKNTKTEPQRLGL